MGAIVNFRLPHRNMTNSRPFYLSRLSGIIWVVGKLAERRRLTVEQRLQALNKPRIMIARTRLVETPRMVLRTNLAPSTVA